MKHFQKNPLRPLIIGRIRRIYLPLPVKRITERTKLLLKPLYVMLRDYLRMDLIFDRVILCRKPERIPPHRVENIVPLHSALARDNVKRRVRPWMAHMKPLTRRIRKFHQRIILRLCKIIGGRKRPLLIPDILPFLLNHFVVVWLCHLFPHFCTAFLMESLRMQCGRRSLFFPETGIPQKRSPGSHISLARNTSRRHNRPEVFCYT